jgi:hypothetical protein
MSRKKDDPDSDSDFDFEEGFHGAALDAWRRLGGRHFLINFVKI